MLETVNKLNKNEIVPTNNVEKLIKKNILEENKNFERKDIKFRNWEIQ